MSSRPSYPSAGIDPLRQSNHQQTGGPCSRRSRSGTRLSAWFAVVLVFFAFRPLVAAERVWTDNTGTYSVKAELLKFEDGKAYLKRADDRVVAIPLDRLSEADRQYLEQLRADQAAHVAAQPNRSLPAVEEVSFHRDVLPILTEHCFQCHSSVSEMPKGDLRLDQADEVAGHLEPGDPEGSYLFDLVNREETDEERMPPANSGPALSAEERNVIAAWISQGADFEGWEQWPNWRKQVRSATKSADFDPAQAIKEIDRLVQQQLDRADQESPEKLSDELFLRRIYLDLAGRIPTIEEARSFYDTPPAQRRNELIDRLIGSEAYASHWYNIWIDALRVQDKFDSSRQADLYMWWIRRALRDNMPYDEFVRRLLSAEGYVWDDPATGYYYRDQSNRLANVEATAALFLGTDIGCAQCHNDPFDVWTRRDYHEFAAYFDSATYFFPREQAFEHLSWEEMEAQRNALKDDADRQRLNWNHAQRDKATTAYHMNKQLLTRVVHPQYFHPRLPHDYQYKDGEPKGRIDPTTLFGSEASFEDHHEGMRVLAEWLTSPENPRFTLTIVNRMWDRLFGHPLAGHLLDVRPIEQTENPELMQHLVQTMIDVDYDLQRFLGILVRTDAYQRRAAGADAGSSDVVKTCTVQLRRMSAEQLWDSVVAMIDETPESEIDPDAKPDYSFHHRVRTARTDEEYWQIIEEIIEEGQGHVATFQASQAKLAESRKTGLLRDQLLRASELPSPAPDGHFLRQFGQSDREVIDNSWNNPTVPQALTLMNGPLFDLLVAEESALRQHLEAAQTREQRIELIWLATLSRPPRPEERALVNEQLADISDTELARHLLWSLLNTRQFLFIE